MSDYTLQEQYNSKNQVAGQSAGDVWHLGARRVTSITIHHWGLKGQQFDTVRDFLCTNDTPTSAHYVVQDGLVACIVSPDDCAFHAGNAEGNTFSVGIECRPEATDGDYATIAELIRDIRAIYGDIPLYPHNHWFNTACPGDYDLARLDALARGTTITTQSATTKEWDEMATPEEIRAVIRDELMQSAKQGDQGRALAWFNWREHPIPGWNGDVSAAARLAGIDQAVNDIRNQIGNLPAQVLNLEFTLTDGTLTNISGILDAIHAAPATVTNVTGASIDVDALVSRLKAELPAAQFEYFKTQITKP